MIARQPGQPGPTHMETHPGQLGSSNLPLKTIKFTTTGSDVGAVIRCFIVLAVGEENEKAVTCNWNIFCTRNFDICKENCVTTTSSFTNSNLRVWKEINRTLESWRPDELSSAFSK